MYCASGWALEGFCDVWKDCHQHENSILTSKHQSLAYEIAPFNIKITIVQANVEIGVLTHKVVSAPPLPAYTPEENPAPLFRNIIDSLVGHLSANQPQTEQPPPTADGEESPEASTPPQVTSPKITSFYPPLTPGLKANLIAETVHALVSIGGHENPPARHIVGHEGVSSVKEKLKTTSEELEDFVDVSSAADIEKEEVEKE